MKHRLLNKWNMLLGSLALMLAGCSTTQKGVQSMKLDTQIKALYGVPMEQYQPSPSQEMDTTHTAPALQTPEKETKQDSTIQEAPHIMVKYGVPFPRQ